MFSKRVQGQKARAPLPRIETSSSGSFPPSDDITPQPSPCGSLVEIVSNRSRASSIFSTGTKTSIGTLAQGPVEVETSTHSGPVDVVLGRRNFRITARPGSILSISSFDHPAPPYTETAPALGVLDPAQPLSSPDVRSWSPSAVEESLTPLSHATPVPRRPRPSDLALPPRTDSESTSPTDCAPSPPSPPLSPFSTSTNALSAHYTSVVRTIDANHRAEITHLETTHTTALAHTRHDIDSAYRPLLRAANVRADAATAKAAALSKDTEAIGQKLRIEKELRAHLDAELQVTKQALEALKSSLSSLSSAAADDKDAAIRIARNEVEDLWEGRWRDRMRLAAEEVGAAHEDGERVGAAWMEEVRRRWPSDAVDVKERVGTILKSGKRQSKRRSVSATGSN